ncbi:hypothetical protein WICMUC_005391 [Wickerhamomyces mucosus]|uniref:Uncharacterized protein n=1 Tax=Wickerhamomyces mucosus TaxID=1378264 RepID=A0A9P8P8T5_9ASCO|nr:hypothetical protein WICMUC_005391 [Wickerhamomyces mucosus]
MALPSSSTMNPLTSRPSSPSSSERSLITFISSASSPFSSLSSSSSSPSSSSAINSSSLDVSLFFCVDVDFCSTISLNIKMSPSKDPEHKLSLSEFLIFPQDKFVKSLEKLCSTTGFLRTVSHITNELERSTAAI